MELFINISKNAWIFLLFFVLKFNTIIIYFVVLFVMALAIRGSFRLPPMFFGKATNLFLFLFLFFWYFLTSWNHTMLQTQFVFFLSYAYNQPLL